MHYTTIGADLLEVIMYEYKFLLGLRRGLGVPSAAQDEVLGATVVAVELAH